MHIETVEPIALRRTNKLAVATRIFKKPNSEGEGVEVNEMRINTRVRPDVAMIYARHSTLVQRYEGDGKETEVLFGCTVIGSEVDTEEGYQRPINCSVGVIKMSPQGDIYLYKYNPDTDGGPRGFTITNGWTMQLVVLPGSELLFYDYWSPRGYCSRGDTSKYYGSDALIEVKDGGILEKFEVAREELVEYLETITKQ